MKTTEKEKSISFPHLVPPKIYRV